MHTYTRIHTYMQYMAASVLFRVPIGVIGIDRGTFSNAYGILINKKYPGGPLMRNTDDTNKTDAAINTYIYMYVYIYI